ncbi:MAG: hypothetical protein ABI598_02610 [Chloroflexota bacterium]
MVQSLVGSRTTRALPMLVVLLVVVLAGCGSTVTPAPLTFGPSHSPAASPSGTAAPGTSATGAPTATAGTSTGASPLATDTPSSGPTATADCTNSSNNPAFFDQAAAGLTWPVYCAVLPDPWRLEVGSFRMANGGHMEVTYRGPGDAHLSLAEGNICFDVGGDVEQCAPRDAVIGDAAFGDLTGELGRLSNGLVLDVDRGANPSWRMTGLGLSEADFTAIGAATIRVPATP